VFSINDQQQHCMVLQLHTTWLAESIRSRWECI